MLRLHDMPKRFFAVIAASTLTLTVCEAAPAPFIAFPILYERGSATDSPRIRLRLFGTEEEFLFDTGTAPTMFFHSYAATHQGALARLSREGEFYRSVKMEGQGEEMQVSHVLEIPDTPIEDFKGVAGLFSPQSIQSGVKVMDFIGGIFYVYPHASTGDVLADFEKRYAAAFHTATWYGVGIRPTPPLLVEGNVGDESARLIDVDTGMFPVRYAFPPGDTSVTLQDGNLASDIFGNLRRQKQTAQPLPVTIEGVMLGAASIVAGETETIEDQAVSGTIGMSLLSNCVVVIPEQREERLYWLCLRSIKVE